MLSELMIVSKIVYGSAHLKIMVFLGQIIKRNSVDYSQQEIILKPVT